MLLTFIVTLVLLAVLYLLINICNKKIVRPKYDFSTGATKSFVIFAHTGVVFSFLVIAVEINTYFFWNEPIALWVIFGLILLLAILNLIVLYGLYFTYEAISGDEVYIRRFFKTKKIKVNLIRRIKRGALAISFYDENNKRLFRVDPNTKGVHKFIHLINESISDGSIEDTQEEISAEETAFLSQIGREYRVSYKKRKKKILINTWSVGIAILAFIVSLFIIIGVHPAYTVYAGVLCVLAVTVNLFAELRGMKKELSEDDVTLGYKHKYTNKKVKGASKNKFIVICIFCVCCMVVGGLLMLALLGISGEDTSYDKYTRVTGELEYYRKYSRRFDEYLAIGFCDIPTEYRLTSIYLDELDTSFFDDVQVGDTVTVLVGNGNDLKFSLSGVSKKQWNHFYYLATDDKEYYSYGDYVKSSEHSNLVSYIIVGYGIVMIVASTATMIGAGIVCKKRAKEEDVVIRKDIVIHNNGRA